MLYFDENNELQHADSFEDIIEHYSFKNFKRDAKSVIRGARKSSHKAGRMVDRLRKDSKHMASKVAEAGKKIRRWGYTNGVPNGKRKAGDKTKNPMNALKKGVAGLQRKGRKVLNDINTLGGRGITINDSSKTKISGKFDKQGYLDEYKTTHGTRYASITDLIKGKELSKTSTTKKHRDNIGGRKMYDHKTGQLIDNRKKKKKKSSKGSVKTEYSFKPR